MPLSKAEVERVDSGVGAETKDVLRKCKREKAADKGFICEDCDKVVEESELEDTMMIDIVCQKCQARRMERKETIQEIVDTEISYGRDLTIIKEEFYKPMQTAALLTAEQLNTIFINLEELLAVNDNFADKLQDALDFANEQGDEDFVTVPIGKLFLEASNMYMAFENYCVNQSAAPILLEQLERDKELLRIFLHVSQTENSLLRRMNLKSFLMVPVQRIMKYPLLLNRLYKATSPQHNDKEAIKKSQLKIEEILDHINAKTRGANSGLRLRRKGSNSKKTAATENFEINKVAIEAVGWNRNEVTYVMSGRLGYAQATDHTWMRKGKTLKFSPVHGVLVTLGQPKPSRVPKGSLSFPSTSSVTQGALVLIREKGGKYVNLREPLMLDHCVVSTDAECEDVFEVHDMGKEAYIFKAEDPNDTTVWYELIKQQCMGLGGWRRRRNALANIMIQNKTK